MLEAAKGFRRLKAYGNSRRCARLSQLTTPAYHPRCCRTACQARVIFSIGNACRANLNKDRRTPSLWALTLTEVIWFEWLDQQYGIWQCGKLTGTGELVLRR
jgi:hypothetical protein